MNWNNLGIGTIIICLLVIGWGCNEIYDNYKEKNGTGGFWVRDQSWGEIKETASQQDPEGNWICVNIKNIDYDRALKICQHEVGHEMFALECENNITKCFEAIE